VTHLTGRVLSLSGEPMLNATIEIWQCDNKGVYIAQGSNGGRNDPTFQGFGRFITGSTGGNRSADLTARRSCRAVVFVF